MKAICKKNLIKQSGNTTVVNSDLQDCLKIGEIYEVYGVEITSNIVYLYVYDGDHILPVPLQMFEIIDDSVTSGWHVRFKEKGSVTIFPKLFYEEDFFENFSEREKNERQLFEKLINSMILTKSTTYE